MTIASASDPAFPPAAAGRLPVGRSVADLASGLVRGPDGTETELRPQSAKVLRVLAARRGEIVSMEALHAAVWGDFQQRLRGGATRAGL